MTLRSGRCTVCSVRRRRVVVADGHHQQTIVDVATAEGGPAVAADARGAPPSESATPGPQHERGRASRVARRAPWLNSVRAGAGGVDRMVRVWVGWGGVDGRLRRYCVPQSVFTGDSALAAPAASAAPCLAASS